MSLQKNIKAPNFTTELNDGSQFELYGAKSKFIILYFYPKDNTPGCTIEACGIRDISSDLKSLGAEIYGVGKGNKNSHNKFIKNFYLNFPLIIDTDLEISRLYDVLVEKSMFGKKYHGIERTTYVLDKDFRIIEVMEKVNPITHSGKLLSFIRDIS